MNNYDVVKKLIGEIEPVGETHTDDKRFENLKEMIELADKLIFDIQQVTERRLRPEFSMSRAGMAAHNFIEEIKG